MTGSRSTTRGCTATQRPSRWGGAEKQADGDDGMCGHGTGPRAAGRAALNQQTPVSAALRRCCCGRGDTSPPPRPIPDRQAAGLRPSLRPAHAPRAPLTGAVAGPQARSMFVCVRPRRVDAVNAVAAHRTTPRIRATSGTERGTDRGADRGAEIRENGARHAAMRDCLGVHEACAAGLSAGFPWRGFGFPPSSAPGTPLPAHGVDRGPAVH